MKIQMDAERKSARELVSSRIIPGAASLVFEAWAKPEVFQQWWVPKSAPIELKSCEMDIRTGGTYRLAFSAGDQTMEFFGKYLEVAPPSRLVWTNDEGGPEAANVTTVSFEETHGATWVTVTDLFPSKEALDAALADGSSGALPEQLQQLEQWVVGKAQG